MSDVTVGPQRFLYANGLKLPVKVTEQGALEFCSKERQVRNCNTRFQQVTVSEIKRVVRENTTAGPEVKTS